MIQWESKPEDYNAQSLSVLSLLLSVLSLLLSLFSLSLSLSHSYSLSHRHTAWQFSLCIINSLHIFVQKCTHTHTHSFCLIFFCSTSLIHTHTHTRSAERR